jgi:hypothetical protein
VRPDKALHRVYLSRRLRAQPARQILAPVSSDVRRQPNSMPRRALSAGTKGSLRWMQVLVNDYPAELE